MKCLGDIFIPWFLDDAQGFYFRLGWTTQWWDVVDLFISLFFLFLWQNSGTFYLKLELLYKNDNDSVKSWLKDFISVWVEPLRCWRCGSFHFLKDFSFSFDKITIYLIWDSFLQLQLLCINDLVLMICFFKVSKA